MFSPSQADVRRFFCAVYAKAQTNQALEAIETIASLWINEHPEYHAALADEAAALASMVLPVPGSPLTSNGRCRVMAALTDNIRSVVAT